MVQSVIKGMIVRYKGPLRSLYDLCWCDAEVSAMARNKQEHLETELVRYKLQVSSLQDRLDAVTKV